MKKSPKHVKAPTKKQLVLRWVVIAIVLLLVVGAVLFAVSQAKKNDEGPVAPPMPEITEEPIATPEPTPSAEPEVPEEPEETEAPEEPEEPEEQEPVMLPDMAENYAKNPDIAGWLWIPDTELNYPIMYTPYEREKYLHLSFEEEYSVGGLPFIDEDCSLDPESDNLLIYGHNMKNRTQFGSIMDYANREYWEEHPVFYYSTLYETRTYEIIACFYDRVYYKHENVFKFYNFVDAEDEAAFDEAINYFKANSCYDTGVTAEYGDSLMTLVTCAYHTDNGRFVVVGRLVTEDQ